MYDQRSSSLSERGALRISRWIAVKLGCLAISRQARSPAIMAALSSGVASRLHDILGFASGRADRSTTLPLVVGFTKDDPRP